MGKGFTFRATNNLSTLLLDAYNSLLEGGVFKDLPPLRVVSITNDSIATLLSAAYIHHNAQSLTAAGIILGTGTNATCFCPISKLAKAKISNKAATKILINTEWSINGTLPVLVSSQTTWDKVLDAANEKPGYQPFEEMVSGRYLGEIVRLAAISTVFATEDEKTFPPKLRQPYSIETKLCSEIEAASCIEDACGLLYANYGSVHFWTPQRVLVLRELVIAVSNRAAALLAAATVGILALNEEFDVVAKDGQQQTVVVGYTGTVLVKYSTFSERCQRFLDRLAGDGRVQLVEARDGGIIGAAVLAGMVASGIT
jgi:hexokinase